MTSKKILVALALLLSATSATLAQGSRHARAYYDSYGGYVASQDGRPSGGQQSPGSGIESVR